MTSDVTLGLAFIAGLISFISPCVLPLVPAYVGYMGGRVTQQVAQRGAALTTTRQRSTTLLHGLFFVLGFTVFFVLFGLLTTAAVSSLTSLGVTEAEVRSGIARIGGTAVILFGLHIMGVLNRVFAWLLRQMPRLDRSPYGNVISALVAIALIGLIYWLFVESWFLTLVVVLVLLQFFRDALKADFPGEFWGRIILRLQSALYMDTRRQSQPTHQYGYLSSALMGIVFSAGWTPCIGPIYGAVLTLASTGGSISEAGVLLTAYSLGLGIPFLATALALDQAQGLFRRLQRNMRVIEAVSGVFLIAIGVLVFSGQLQRLSTLGSGGSLSLNMENCTVGVFEGRVRPGSWLDCLGDGVKEEFYIAAPRVIASADLLPAAAQASDTTSSGPAASDSSGGLDVPDLGGSSAPTAAPLSSAPEAANVPVGLNVGQRAPDFSAQTLDGRTVSLSDYRGKVVLVNFWATWCIPCRSEMPDFQTIYDVHGPDGFVVLAVNYQEPKADVEQFANEFELNFPLLLDESGTISNGQYKDKIPGLPTSFLIDQNGVIVQYYPKAVDGAQVLDALDRLLNS